MRASWLALPLWKHVQPLAPVAPTGTYSDVVTAPQPLGPSGPMAQDHLTTTGTQDVDLILFQALKMNIHEVPSYCSFRANTTTLMFPRGSTASGKVQYTSLQQTNFDSLQNRWPVRQTGIRDESLMSRLCGTIQG